MSSDKIKVFYSEGENQKLKLLVEPGIEWADLLELISGKLKWSRNETRLWKKDGDTWMVLTSDVLPLENLDILKAEKIQTVPSCMGAVLPKNRIWTDSRGKIMDEIRVYFFRDKLPSDLMYNGYPLQCNTIIKMVNGSWNCKEEVEKLGVVGARVPKFVDLGVDCNLGDADIRVGFEAGGSYSKLGSEAQGADIPVTEPTMVLDLAGKSSTDIQFNVVHEFGHALGLCHEHQHPKYLEVMSDFQDEFKMHDLFRQPGREGIGDFELQYLKLPDSGTSLFKPEYDPRSIMHYPTYYGFLEDDYQSKIKSRGDLDVMLAEKEIDDTKYNILKGFVMHINLVFPEPSEGDRQAVAKAYCDYYKSWKDDNPAATVEEKAATSAPTASAGTQQKPPTVKKKYLGRGAPKTGDLTLLKNRKMDTRFNLSDKIVMSWRTIGTILGIADDRLTSYLEDSNGNNSKALSKVFGIWLSNAEGLPKHDDYPLSWQGLYNLLEDSDRLEIAKEYFAFLDDI